MWVSDNVKEALRLTGKVQTKTCFVMNVVIVL